MNKEPIMPIAKAFDELQLADGQYIVKPKLN
jgi:hypothetical protein